MTENDWLACSNPVKMLEFLKGTASERKLRLFAVACVRRSWSHLTDERSRQTVGIAEREADGSGSKEALRLAEEEAKAAIPSLALGIRPSEQAAAEGAMAVVNVNAAEAASLACEWARGVSLALAYEQALGGDLRRTIDLRRTKERGWVDWAADAVATLRCIFGNPFSPISLDPVWLTPSVTALAKAIYDNRRFTELSVLAEALEAAGCRDIAILKHCREPAEHFLGCWVVDLLLQKA
jgi:hypothetical protein